MVPTFADSRSSDALEPEPSDDPKRETSVPGAAKATPHWSRKRRLLYGCILVIGSLFVTFSILELGLRLGRWDVRSLHHIGALHRHHPTLGREQIPGWEAIVASGAGEVRYRVNRHGFRGPDDTSRERVPGLDRIVLAGDSLTWGWGGQETEMMSEQLESRIRAEVLNFGMNAVGTGLEWLLLEERGFAFRPDIVVLNFFVGNDYRNNLSRSEKRPHFEVGDAGRVVVKNVPVPYPLSKRCAAFAKRNFLSYFFVGYYAGRARIEIKYSPRWYGSLYRALGGGVGSRKRGEARLSRLDKFLVQPNERIQRAYDITELLLREIRDSCAKRDVRFLVAILPGRFQVDASAWDALLRQGKVHDRRRFDRAKPTQVCREICERLGIEAVDLLPRLREHHPATPVYLPEDIHFNPEGHRLAAAEIARKLQQLGWVSTFSEVGLPGGEETGNRTGRK